MDNQKKMITGYVIDPANGTAYKKTIPDDLEAYYDLLDCKTIEIVSRAIGAGRHPKTFEIVCDEEGLFVEKPVVTAVNKQGEMMFVGALFVCRYGGDGELESLTDDDIDYLRSQIAVFRMPKTTDFYVGLTNVDYA